MEPCLLLKGLPTPEIELGFTRSAGQRLVAELPGLLLSWAKKYFLFNMTDIDDRAIQCQTLPPLFICTQKEITSQTD